MPLFNSTPIAFLQNDTGTPTIISGTILAGTAVVSLNTNVFNSTTAISYATGTGLATINVAGYYMVTAQIDISATYTVGQVARVAITKNGTTLQYGIQTAAAGAIILRPSVCIPVSCAAGDTIGILAFSNGSSGVLQTEQAANFLGIVAIK